MAKRKPLVVVTGPAKRLTFGWWATRFMLRLMGVNATYITAKTRTLPDTLDGVIIGGGDDIEPSHYGLMGDAGSEYDPDRDALELRVVRAALESHVPIMGICRGAQLINIVHGGNLHKDIRPQRKVTPNRNSIFPIKSVELQGHSQLSRSINKSKFRINSLHKQAINVVGDGLDPVAHDEDGFIQAVESCHDEQTIIAVQWHPEYMPYSATQRRLFRHFRDELKRQPDKLKLAECFASQER